MPHKKQSIFRNIQFASSYKCIDLEKSNPHWWTLPGHRQYIKYIPKTKKELSTHVHKSWTHSEQTRIQNKKPPKNTKWHSTQNPSQPIPPHYDTSQNTATQKKINTLRDVIPPQNSRKIYTLHDVISPWLRLTRSTCRPWRGCARWSTAAAPKRRSARRPTVRSPSTSCRCPPSGPCKTTKWKNISNSTKEIRTYWTTCTDSEHMHSKHTLESSNYAIVQILR